MLRFSNTIIKMLAVVPRGAYFLLQAYGILSDSNRFSKRVQTRSNLFITEAKIHRCFQYRFYKLSFVKTPFIFRIIFSVFLFCKASGKSWPGQS